MSRLFRDRIWLIGRLRGNEVAQHVVQDAAMAVVFELVERIDAQQHRHDLLSCHRHR